MDVPEGDGSIAGTYTVEPLALSLTKRRKSAKKLSISVSNSCRGSIFISAHLGANRIGDHLHSFASRQ